MRLGRAIPTTMIAIVMLFGGVGVGLAQEDEPDEPPPIRMARATWDTG